MPTRWLAFLVVCISTFSANLFADTYWQLSGVTIGPKHSSSLAACAPALNLDAVCDAGYSNAGMVLQILTGVEIYPTAGGTYAFCKVQLLGGSWQNGCFSNPTYIETTTNTKVVLKGNNCSNLDPATGLCMDKNTNPGNQCPDPVAGNPINVLTGKKSEVETDYKNDYLQFNRNYVSAESGKQWHFSYHAQKIRYLKYTYAPEFSGEYPDLEVAAVNRGNGYEIYFKREFGQSIWQADADIREVLVDITDSLGSPDGYQLTDVNNNLETYSKAGLLKSITSRDGKTITFNYQISSADGGDDNDQTLDQVIDPFNRILKLTYDEDQHITGMIDPAGESYVYHYDGEGNLLTVVYPDTTPADDADNPTRTYHYENTQFPHALTGITDENNVRYVTWEYDTEGRAYSSQLAGAGAVVLDYANSNDAVDPRVTVTNELGKQTTYHFTMLHGVKKVTQIEGHATASCAGANKAHTYGSNGFLASKTDWHGNLTTYIRNVKGQELSRVEAAGTPEARTITTEWHASFRLPIKVTEPGKVTDYSYDAQGRLLSQTITAP